MSALQVIVKLLVREHPEYNFGIRRVPFGYMLIVRRGEMVEVRHEKMVLVDDLYDVAKEMVGEIERKMWHDAIDAIEPANA